MNFGLYKELMFCNWVIGCEIDFKYGPSKSLKILSFDDFSADYFDFMNFDSLF